MIVSRKHNQLTDFNVKINDKNITRTTCVKYLRVFVDDKLTWSNHVAYLENKLSCSVGPFFRIRQYLSDSALKSLHFSFVYSHLQFAIGAWGGVGITTLNQLNVLHNKIIRAMTCSSFRTKITPLYKLNLLKLDDIYSLELGKIMQILLRQSSWQLQPPFHPCKSSTLSCNAQCNQGCIFLANGPHQIRKKIFEASRP